MLLIRVTIWALQKAPVLSDYFSRSNQSSVVGLLFRSNPSTTACHWSATRRRFRLKVSKEWWFRAPGATYPHQGRPLGYISIDVISSHLSRIYPSRNHIHPFRSPLCVSLQKTTQSTTTLNIASLLHLSGYPFISKSGLYLGLKHMAQPNINKLYPVGSLEYTFHACMTEL